MSIRANIWAVLVMAALFTANFMSCVKLEFDEPPVAELPSLTPDHTIAEVKALHSVGSAAREITEDWIIGGIVVGDDQSGNFFRQIAIQDATGGIIVRINSNGLFNDYPVGRELFIRLKGLYIGDFNGLYQLNGSATGGIEEVLLGQYILPGEPNMPIAPKVVSLAELNANIVSLQSTVVQLNDVEFTSANAGVVWADAVNRVTVNRTLKDCGSNQIIVRTSGFADFAPNLTPTGKGSLIAVASVFGTTPQLALRTPAEVDMGGPRCDGGGGGTGGELMTVAALRAVFTGTATTAPANKKIRGVVISDRANNNWDGRNMVVQDGEAGIAVRFSDTHNFSLGDEIEIGVGGVELSEFNGLLQLNSTPNGNAVKVGTAAQPTPRVATVAQVLANVQAWESTLVRINGATLGGNATYAGFDVEVTDATGSVQLFTRNAANFSGSALPTGTVDIVTVVSEFNSPQLVIRNTSDVIGGGGGGGDPESITAAELRTLFTGGASSVPAGKKIRGIVISDRSNATITDRNMVLQDATGGIVVRFTANNTFNIGEEVEIVVSNVTLSEFNGLLQLENAPNANASSFGPGTLPTPRVATVAEVLANATAWQSTLVRISNVTFPEGGAYSGNKNATDGTGTIPLFTRTQATFSSANVPAGAVTVTAIVSRFNDPQINIRSLSDVTP